MRYQDGRAWIVGCPKCWVPIVESHIDGHKYYVSRFAVPLNDAMVMSKYLRIVVNIWDGVNVLMATPWHFTSGKPSRGRLYVAHSCGAWK